MLTLLDVNIENDTLVTIFLIVAIIALVLWIVAFILGRVGH